ncbi:MAG: transglycosylase domain-containing protein, partial [Tannerella sp.]|nr:transglycosylase domain-containing protein [Tannerella sp.]
MRAKLRKKIVIAFWSLYVLGVALIVLAFTAIAKGWIGYMPPLEQLANPIDKYASVVLSSDGEILGSYAQSQDNRLFVEYKDLSPDLVKALIATEDVRFAKHSGIDVLGLMRALVKRGLLMQKSGGGGSTITQQLAKQLYSPTASSFLERLLQKPIEWVIAVKLERYYTKEEIINLYLNKFDFLYNAVGIRSAAQVYFSTTPKGLRTEEAATLIGMCKNPSYYNPVRHNERTRLRRNVVLHQMQKAGFLTLAQRDSLSALPLKLHFSKMDHKDGLAPYFREYLRGILTAHKPDPGKYPRWMAARYREDSTAWATDPLYGWCNKNKKPDGSYYNLYTDGLKIHATIDARMQEYAEEAVREQMEDLQPKFFAEKRGRSYAPFSSDLKPEEINDIMTRSMRQTDRYRALKQEGKSEAEIRKLFHEKTEMSVFSWHGRIDTLMSPWDSIRWHKSFLRASMMAMNPHTGEVKVYVGGIDYRRFKWDGVTMQKRQVGSTFKPFLYTTAFEEKSLNL